MSPINQHHPLARSIVRILTADNHVIGTGFLVADRIICTCAHVVARAVGTEPDDAVPPDALVALDFPFFKERKKQDCAESGHDNFPIKFEAHVIAWKPLKRDDDSGDIALLALSSEPPAGVASARLLSFLSWAGIDGKLVDIYGFPTNYEHAGLWTGDYRLDKPLVNGLLQMTGTTALGIDIRPGNSGAPVWDKENEGVVGMVSTRAGGSDVDNRVAFLIPNSLIVELHPPLQASLRVLSTAPDWVADEIYKLDYRLSNDLIHLAELFWTCPHARNKENWRDAHEIDDVLDAVHDRDYATHPDEVQALEAYINKILPQDKGIERAAVRQFIRLLRPIRPISWDGQLLTVLFKECRPSEEPPDHSEADRLLIAIVRKLARFPVQGEKDKWHPLLKFSYLLVHLKLSTGSLQEQQIASDLRDWIKEQASILNIPAPSSPVQNHKDKRAVLFISIRHDTQADIRNLHLSTFWVSAWLMPVDTSHNPIEILPYTGYKLAALLNALRDVLDEHATKHSLWKIALIELCVPWMLLFYSLEQKHVIPVPFPQQPQPLVADYPVVFRLQERLPPRRDQERGLGSSQHVGSVIKQRQMWNQKWREYQGWRCAPRPSNTGAFDHQNEIIFCPEHEVLISYSYHQIFGTLILQTMFGVAHTFTLTEHILGDVHDEKIEHVLREVIEGDEINRNIIGAVIQSGIPIAFFARGMSKTHQELHALLRQFVHEEIYDWIKEGDILEFGEWLKQQYYAQYDNVLGKHLVVLWDDPDRTPFDDPLDDTGIV